MAAFNHKAPCAVKRAGFVDVGATEHSTSANHRRFWRDPARFVDSLAYKRDGELANHNMRKKDPKRSAAGRKAIQTIRRKAGDAYLSRLGKKAAATKRRKRKK
jgi:hypothetical protein